MTPAHGYDAILVPGGGLALDGGLPEHVKRRFDLALERESGEPIAPLSAWTAHRPVLLDGDGRQVYESLVGARYLMDRGVKPERIFCESTAYDTIGNAYFSRVQLVDPFGWRRLLIVTSRFHMARTEAIFRWVYSLNGIAGDADAPSPYVLDFAASADDGLSESALTVRRAREEASLRTVKAHRERITSFPALARWLFTEHSMYAALRGPIEVQVADLLRSY
jgi:hypothetical protein